MNDQQDQARVLRIRDEALIDLFSQGGREPSSGMPCLVARTKRLTTYPTSAGKFFACSPVIVLGPEVEGGAGSLTVGTATFFALNLGSVAPPQGTNVLATFVDNRWVFRYEG